MCKLASTKVGAMLTYTCVHKPQLHTSLPYVPKHSFASVRTMIWAHPNDICNIAEKSVYATVHTEFASLQNSWFEQMCKPVFFCTCANLVGKFANLVLRFGYVSCGNVQTCFGITASLPGFASLLSLHAQLQLHMHLHLLLHLHLHSNCTYTYT